MQVPCAIDPFIVAWTEISIFEIITSVRLLVTKLGVTQSTIMYQMKDMDIIFLLTPHTLLRVLETTAFQSQAFFQNAQNHWKLAIETAVKP